MAPGVTLKLLSGGPAAPADGVHHDPEEPVEQADHLLRSPGRRQLRGPDQVDEQHCDLALLAPELGPPFQRPPGDVLSDLAAEHVTHPFPFGQIADHVVEAGLQQAHLAGVVDLHVCVVVTALHLTERPA